MAYEKKDWQNDELITEDALDNMENGIKTADDKNTEQDGKITALESKTNKATTETDGLMSKEDKSKLDGISAQANKYVLPVATTEAFGGVKQVAKVDAVSSPDAVASAESNPTKAEFDKVVTLVNELKSKFNDGLTKVITAGIMKNS